MPMLNSSIRYVSKSTTGDASVDNPIRASLIIEPTVSRKDPWSLPFSPIRRVVISSVLMHAPLISLTKLLGSCAKADYKFTTRFSSLFSSLSSTSTFSQLIVSYYTCSKLSPSSQNFVLILSWVACAEPSPLLKSSRLASPLSSRTRSHTDQCENTGCNMLLSFRN
jgi:hypothetical protein